MPVERTVQVGRVPSLSDPTVSWAIFQRGEELICECPAYGSWKKRGLPCWHLRVWTSAEKALQGCYAAHGGDGGDRQALCHVCLLALLAALSAAVKKRYVPKPEKKPRAPKERTCTCRHGDSKHLLATTTRGLSCCTEPGCDCRTFTEKPKRKLKPKVTNGPA